MAEGDTIVVRDGHQVLGPAVLLTGGETTQGHIYRGPTEPTTPAPLEGDIWIDTTGGAPFQTKTLVGVDWVLSPLVSRDALGVMVARISVTAQGTTHEAFGPDGIILRAFAEVRADGAVSFTTYDAVGTPVSFITMDENGNSMGSSGGPTTIGSVGAPADLAEGSMLDGNLLGYRATDVGALAMTVSDPPTQAEVQAIATKVDLFRTNLRASGEMA